MSIIEALVAARGEMPPLVADETASISGTRGSYKFKYVSLPAILKTVVPVLAKHNIYMFQDVGTTQDGAISLVTKLSDGKDAITSSILRIQTDGSTKDIAGKVTSARRIQLLAILGLAAEDEEDVAPAPTPVQRSNAQPASGSWGDEAPLRQAKDRALKTNILDMTPALAGLVSHLRDDDAKQGEPMGPGTYRALLGLMNGIFPANSDKEIALSFLYGRVITEHSTPLLTTTWFGMELKEGSWQAELREAYRLATA